MDELLPLLDVPGTARGPYNKFVCAIIDIGLRVPVDSRSAIAHSAVRQILTPAARNPKSLYSNEWNSLYGMNYITSTVTRNSAGLRARPDWIHSPNNYQSKNGPLEPASDPNPSGTLEHFGGRSRPRPTTNPC